MKNLVRTRFAPPLKWLLLTGMGLLSLSPLSTAEPLKIGDAYGGGKIAYILQPGDNKYAEFTEEAVIIGKAEVSAALYWVDTKTSYDRLDAIGYNVRNWPGQAQQDKLAGGITHKTTYPERP